MYKYNLLGKILQIVYYYAPFAELIEEPEEKKSDTPKSLRSNNKAVDHSQLKRKISEGRFVKS